MSTSWLQKIRDGWIRDRDMGEVVKGTFRAFAVKFVGAALGFLFTVAVTRTLGAERSGIFFLALTLVTIASIIGRLGLDTSVFRFTAERAHAEDWAAVRDIYATGRRMVLLGAGAASLLIAGSTPWLAGTLFGKPELAQPLRWMSLSIIPFSLLNLQAENLKGAKKIPLAMSLQMVGVSACALVLVVPLAGAHGTTGAVWAYVIATVAVLIMGAAARKAALPRRAKGEGTVSMGKLWTSSRHLLVVNLVNHALLPWIPLVLLGIWGDAVSVGIFGAATRVAGVIGFFLLAVNTMVAPKFAELLAKNDPIAIGRVARKAAVFISLLASPALIVMIVAGGRVLQLFGREFASGGASLAVLAGGAFINIYCGSVGYLLIMSGNERVYRNATILSSVLQVMLAVLLIPVWGMVGAAIASAVGVAAVNVVSVYWAWKNLGIITAALPFVRTASRRPDDMRTGTL